MFDLPEWTLYIGFQLEEDLIDQLHFAALLVILVL